MSMFVDRPTARWLQGGGRLNLRHGPIDLIIEATGQAHEVAAAYKQAASAFCTVLDELSDELDVLRAQSDGSRPRVHGMVAREMLATVSRFSEQTFITPMICVAGAVADHVLKSLVEGRALHRAYVNNGGDIAVFLTGSATFDVGICGDLTDGNIASTVKISGKHGVGGIATSGWRGRSHSFGIADAVTVLAADAATADAAATLIANAIDLPGHPGVQRQPAIELAPDSDLGERLVTTNVGCLSETDVRRALAVGKALADQLASDGAIIAAFGMLQRNSFATGHQALSPVRPVSPEGKHTNVEHFVNA